MSQETIYYDIQNLYAVSRYLRRHNKCKEVRFNRNGEKIEFKTENKKTVGSLDNNIITTCDKKQFSFDEIAHENNEAERIGKKLRSQKEVQTIAAELIREFNPPNKGELTKCDYAEIFEFQDSKNWSRTANKVTLLSDAKDAEYEFKIGGASVLFDFKAAVRLAKDGSTLTGFRPVHQSGISRIFITQINDALQQLPAEEAA